MNLARLIKEPGLCASFKLRIHAELNNVSDIWQKFWLCNLNSGVIQYIGLRSNWTLHVHACDLNNAIFME